VGVRPSVCSLQVGSDADAKLFPQISKRQGTRPLTAVGGLLACRSIGAGPLPGPTPRILPTSPSDVTPVPSFPPPTAAAHHCSFAAVSQFRFGGPASHYHDDFYPCQFSPARLAPNCTTALPPLLATSTSPCLIRRWHATPHAVRRVGPELRIGRVRSGGPLGHDGACWHRCSMPSESPTLSRGVPHLPGTRNNLARDQLEHPRTLPISLRKICDSSEPWPPALHHAWIKRPYLPDLLPAPPASLTTLIHVSSRTSFELTHCC
jgi:hypothetical protein